MFVSSQFIDHLWIGKLTPIKVKTGEYVETPSLWVTMIKVSNRPRL
jgi:hypothetical protein